jgi:hypothetical protein
MRASSLPDLIGQLALCQLAQALGFGIPRLGHSGSPPRGPRRRSTRAACAAQRRAPAPRARRRRRDEPGRLARTDVAPGPVQRAPEGVFLGNGTGQKCVSSPMADDMESPPANRRKAEAPPPASNTRPSATRSYPPSACGGSPCIVWTGKSPAAGAATSWRALRQASLAGATSDPQLRNSASRRTPSGSGSRNMATRSLYCTCAHTLFLHREFSLPVAFRGRVLGGTAAFPSFLLKANRSDAHD